MVEYLDSAEYLNIQPKAEYLDSENRIRNLLLKFGFGLAELELTKKYSNYLDKFGRILFPENYKLYRKYDCKF